MSEQLYIGVDLGGTSIKVGLCDTQGTLLATHEGPTRPEDGWEAGLDRVVQLIREMVERASVPWNQVAGLGAGVAGFLELSDGSIRFSNNLGWRDVPVKRVLEQKLGVAVCMHNDANVAGLGEAWVGAGKGISNLVCYTLGTGVGGSIIINGQLVEGFKGLAGELGHMNIVPDLEATSCTCGQKGCLETVSSATAILRMARDAVERGDRTALSLLDTITTKDVFDAAKTGDEVSLRIINRAAYYLGRSMALLTAILNPQRFIVGGGVANAGDILFDAIRQNYRKYALEPFAQGVDIVPAALGNHAGIVGAARLAMIKLNQI